jgi:intracellular multiplication protein IcmE
MTTPNQGTRLAGIFSGAGGAGPRRLAIMGGTVIMIFAVVSFVLMRGHRSPLQSTVAPAPSVNPLPGGMHSNDYYSQLAMAQAQSQAKTAAAAGQSSVAPMPAGEPNQSQIAPVNPLPPPAVPSVARAIAPPDFAPLEPRPASVAVPQAAAPAPPQTDDKQVQFYASAISSLLAGWSDAPSPETNVVLKPGDTQPTGSTGTAALGGPSPMATMAGQPRGTADSAPGGSITSSVVLIPAGKGVYARSKLAANSDQGGPVVVTAESGPIAGDDMIGSFDQRGNRLVVTLNTITLSNGKTQSIDALVIAPDTMETAVASSVDQHYLARFMLPVAAAFVAGLGQAVQQSSATVAVSPLGGYTSQNHLNFDQELGVGAGAAGSQLQNLLLQNAPKGSTVKLDANVNVGVIFLQPLTVPAQP